MDHYYQNIHYKEKQFKTSAVFEEDLLNLTIFENGKAWNINVPKEEVTKQSKDSNLKNYYDKLKGYLRSCPNDVEFNFVQGKFTINLLLKNDMKILFFSSILKQVDFVEKVFFLTDTLYKEKTQYFEELYNLKKQCKNLQKDCENLKEKMDIFLERRKIEEQKQYSSFVGILNEKKQHIQHLNDLLIAFRKGRPTVNPPVIKRKNENQSKKNVPTKKVTKIEPVSESDSNSATSLSDNYNTDNEEAENINEVSTSSLISTTKANSPGPTTSKSSFLEYSPPTISLPVSRQIRIRSDLSFGVQLPEKMDEELDTSDTKIDMHSSRANDELSPTVSFSTQDLLDNL